MGRFFFFLWVHWLALAALAANAAPRLRPPIPPLNAFPDCTPVTELEDFDAAESCFHSKGKTPKDLGSAIDGDSSKRHFSWQLNKYTKKVSFGEITYYAITQYGFDCRSKQLISRLVYGVMLPKGLPAEEDHSIDIKKWTSKPSIDMAIMKSFCPVRRGFVRINDAEIGVDYAVRKGSLVNVEAILPNGTDGVYTIDCSRMTIGFERPPSKPIKPRTVGHEIYKRLCN